MKQTVKAAKRRMPDKNKKAISKALKKFYKIHTHHSKGVHLTKAHLKKLSIASSGQNNAMYGKKGKLCPFFGKHHSKKVLIRQKKIETTLGCSFLRLEVPVHLHRMKFMERQQCISLQKK